MCMIFSLFCLRTRWLFLTKEKISNSHYYFFIYGGSGGIFTIIVIIIIYFCLLSLMLLLPVMTTYFVNLKTNAILDDQLSVKDQERISIIPSLTGYCLEDFYMSRL